MNIAIIAHDKKKELMATFCTKYAGVLSRHKLYATGTTGKILRDIGLDVHCFMAGRLGGDEQIAARIAYDEIDLLLFFRDNLTAGSYEPKDSLLRLCDIHNVILATNVVTAEIIIKAIENGDCKR